MARDIYDIGAIFCCGLPFLAVVVFILTAFNIPDGFFVVILLVSVCLFNGVWSSVKPRIKKDKDKNQNFDMNYPQPYSFPSTGVSSNNFPHPKICPNCGSIMPEDSQFCPNCGSHI